MEQLLLPIDTLVGEEVERLFDENKAVVSTLGRSANSYTPLIDTDMLCFWYEMHGQQRLPFDAKVFERRNRFVQSAEDLRLLPYATLPGNVLSDVHITVRVSLT